MPWNYSGSQYAHFVNENIPYLSSNLIGYNGVPEGTANDEDRYYYYENYRRFHIEFSNELGNVPLCTIQSGVDDPLTGNSPTFSSFTL